MAGVWHLYGSRTASVWHLYGIRLAGVCTKSRFGKGGLTIAPPHFVLSRHWRGRCLAVFPEAPKSAGLSA